MSMSVSGYLWLNSLIRHFHWLLTISLLIFLLFSYFRLNRRATLLFSLALPGAVVWCAKIGADIAVSAWPNIPNSLFGLFFGFPSALLLPTIALFQAFRLRAPDHGIKLSGFLWAALIIVSYAWTTAVMMALR